MGLTMAGVIAVGIQPVQADVQYALISQYLRAMANGTIMLTVMPVFSRNSIISWGTSCIMLSASNFSPESLGPLTATSNPRAFMPDCRRRARAPSPH